MKEKYTNEDLRLLAELLPQVSAQLRGSFSTIYAAFERIAPEERRAADPTLNQQSAILLQSFFRVLRLSGNLTDVSDLCMPRELPLRNSDLISLLRELCRQVSPLAENAGLKFSFEPEAERLILALNQNGVERIVYNLLSNAFKFTRPGGRVTVLCRQAGTQALIAVRDTGCGISAELLPTVFERCLHTERLDPAPHGLGLGLPLSRHLAEKLGGRLLIDSAEGKGTTVTLSLPVRTVTGTVSDLPFDYAGGFSRPMVELSDALPYQAFAVEMQEK